LTLTLTIDKMGVQEKKRSKKMRTVFLGVAVTDEMCSDVKHWATAQWRDGNMYRPILITIESMNSINWQSYCYRIEPLSLSSDLDFVALRSRLTTAEEDRRMLKTIGGSTKWAIEAGVVYSASSILTIKQIIKVVNGSVFG